jgi:Novel STAND NTPase 1/TIR domain/WD domain, G-beta repeat
MKTQSTDTQLFDVFLSHNSRDKPAVEAIAYKLRAAALNPWLDKEQLIPGERWQGGLAGGLRASSTCAVFIGKDDLGNWESEELDVAQNRAANDRDFRIIPVLLPGLPDPFDPSSLPAFLLSRTWVDFRPGIDNASAFRRLVCAIKGIPPGLEDGGPSIVTNENAKTELVPYLRLNTFDEADAGLFFGRDADVQRLVEKLKAARFLAVIGASGTRLAGLKVEPELLAEALAEVCDQPGTLPLLEYALLEVWKLKRDGRLTLKAYRESGGVKEALSKRAETIYEGLSASQQEIAQRVMLRLTQPGEGTDDTRRRARMSELATRNDEREAVAEVVGALTDARLLTTSKDDQTQDQMVDVSHEALIRGWPRLRKWVEEDRAGLRTLLRLNEAAQEWQREYRDEGLLYRGARLAVALEWRTRNEGKLNEMEREFLAASEALKVLEEEEREATQRRELDATCRLADTERKARKRLQLFTVSLLALLIAATAISLIAFRQWRRLYDADLEAALEAHEKGNIARVQELLNANQSAPVRDFSYFRWMDLWTLYHDELATLEGHAASVLSVAFSPDGKTLASGCDDKTVKLLEGAAR